LRKNGNPEKFKNERFRVGWTSVVNDMRPSTVKCAEVMQHIDKCTRNIERIGSD